MRALNVYNHLNRQRDTTKVGGPPSSIIGPNEKHYCRLLSKTATWKLTGFDSHLRTSALGPQRLRAVAPLITATRPQAGGAKSTPWHAVVSLLPRSVVNTWEVRIRMTTVAIGSDELSSRYAAVRLNWRYNTARSSQWNNCSIFTYLSVTYLATLACCTNVEYWHKSDSNVTVSKE